MSGSAPSRTFPQPSSETRRFRSDIQGLRALAVVLVVVNHAFDWPAGGFVGVDVFFVISGYLITGLLLREYERTGRISFQQFYVRRLKRIVPAAAVTLAVTTIVAYLVWYPARANQTLLDALSSLFFVSNWHFVRQGTDYLQADGPESPVQHFWSLAVEEQFYIVWPILVLVLCLVAAKVARRRTMIVAGGMAAGVVVSLAWSVFTSSRMPEFAYFDTIGRVWELGAGAVAAVLLPKLRLSRVAGTVFSWVGLAVLVASALAITPESPFPGPWGLLPVAGALLVIAGGTSSSGAVALTNPVTQYFGRISYSLYLWHFPVIVFAAALVPGESAATVALTLPVMLLLAHGSYRFVERPAIESRFLRDRGEVRRAGQVVIAATVAVFVLAMSATQLRGPSAVVDPQAWKAPMASTPVLADWDDEAAVERGITAAVRSDTWPDVDLAGLGSSDAAPGMDDEHGCRNRITSQQPRFCDRPASGTETRTVLVIGDSVAVSWLPAVQEALPEWHVVGLGYASCPAVPVRVGTGTNAQACADAQEKMLATVADVKPNILITSSAQSSLDHLASGATGAAAADEWAAATSAFVDATTPNAGQVFVLGNPPAGIDPQACLTRLTGPHSCESTLDTQWVTKAAAEANGAKHAGGEYVDVRDWFCTTDGQCPMTIGDTILRFDGAHLTNDASASYGTLLAHVIAP